MQRTIYFSKTKYAYFLFSWIIMKMSIVSTIIIPMLMVELNLANSQSVDCSISSDDCLLFLASNFTKDCNAGRLANYAECLSNDNCLSSATANVQLNLQYCREGGCIISCVGKYRVCIHTYVPAACNYVHSYNYYVLVFM